MLKRVFALALLSLVLINQPGAAQDKPLERIVYAISPIGVSIYEDMGVVDMFSKKMNLVVFKTNVAGFHDTEKIYSDLGEPYPAWIERQVNMWLGEEFLIERYFPKENRVLIKKFKNKKKVDEFNLKGNGPIHNAILLPFFLRKDPNLKIGWSTVIRLPAEYKVTLISLERVVVPAGTFNTFHFTSIPHSFEIWITADKDRIPVKIKGVGFSYTLVMQERSVK